MPQFSDAPRRFFATWRWLQKNTFWTQTKIHWDLEKYPKIVFQTQLEHGDVYVNCFCGRKKSNKSPNKKHLQVLSCPNQGDIGQWANCLRVGHVIRKCRHRVDLIQNPVNNGKNYLSTGAGFLPSTVSYIQISDLFQIAWKTFQKIFSQNGGFMVMNLMVQSECISGSKRGGDVKIGPWAIIGNNRNNLEVQATSFQF